MTEKTSTRTGTFPARDASSFSFDTLVSEVDAIVEDLRWLHLELTLRNQCNEVLFHDHDTVHSLVESVFSGLRQRLGAFELAVFTRERTRFTLSLREADEWTPWGDDRTPWIDSIDRWIDARPHSQGVPQPVVNHYTVNLLPITSIAMPVRVGGEYKAVILAVVKTSNVVPRLRKLLSGLAATFGLSIGYTLEMESEAALAPEPEQSAFSGGEPLTPGSASIVQAVRGSAAVLLDPSLRIVETNNELSSMLGVSAERLVGRPFLETAVQESDRNALRDALGGALAARSSEYLQIVFRIRMPDGTSVPSGWVPALIPASGTDGSEEGTNILLLGSRMEQERYDSTTGSGPQANQQQAMQARLAKQYRFLMKYVPFPIVHLDAESDIIRNANPAFAALIGTERWEGVPLADFATLHVQSGQGDSLPCLLYVVGRDGLTLHCRGIITPLLLFGKVIREIKLDPIELPQL